MATTSSDNRSEDSYPLRRLTGQILRAAHHVHRDLGYGFTEPVYRRALAVELQYRGIAVSQEVPYEVVYRGVVVGVYRADMVVESSVIIETKTGLVLDPVSAGQLLSYLSAARLPVGLICHFGPRLQVKRMVRSEHADRAQRMMPTPESIAISDLAAVRLRRAIERNAEDAATADAEDAVKARDLLTTDTRKHDGLV